MPIVRGHYDGSVVVLDEPAPVNYDADVTVNFPVSKLEPAPDSQDGEWRYHWHETRKIMEGCDVDSTDIIRQMRDEN